MEIKDLQPKQGKIDLVGKIVSKEEPRTFDKFGKQGRVCNAVLKDSTGEVKLTLWNEQVDQVKVGDKVEMKNGYAGEWQGEIQLSTGKFGSLKVIGDESVEKSAPEESGGEDVNKIAEELDKNEAEIEKEEESPEDEELDFDEEKVE